MEISTGLRGGAFKITDIKVIGKGFIVPRQDLLLVNLIYSEIGQPDFNFTVTLPFMESLRYLRENGKDHFMAKINGEAEDVLSEIAELDTSEKSELFAHQERALEMSALVEEIRSEMGLVDKEEEAGRVQDEADKVLDAAVKAREQARKEAGEGGG